MLSIHSGTKHTAVRARKGSGGFGVWAISSGREYHGAAQRSGAVSDLLQMLLLSCSRCKDMCNAEDHLTVSLAVLELMLDVAPANHGSVIAGDGGDAGRHAWIVRGESVGVRTVCC